MKKFIALILMLCCILSLAACGQKSPYEALNEEEKVVFDILKLKLSAFKNPASVKLMDIEPVGDTCVCIEISAENSYGGTVSESYLLFFKTTHLPSGKLLAQEGHMEEINDFLHAIGDEKDVEKLMATRDFIRSSPTKDVEYSTYRLNEAIKEYKVLRSWTE